MVLPVSELGCPTCGAILGPYELLCPSCGAKLKHLMKVENLPPRQRELHDIANGAIGQASAHLGNARRLGVKVDLADDLLAMAKLLDLAHTWVMHQQQADAKGRKESAQAAA